MRRINCNVLSANDTASHNGSTIDANQLISASFQAVFGDNTAVGTVKIQMSNDINVDLAGSPAFEPTNWTDIPNASASITAGGTAVILLSQLSYRWIRAVYTSSSGGSTTLNINLFALSM